MGAIKDIIDLAKDLESSVKERKDLETLQKIHALASELQSKQLEIVERDIRLVEGNAELKRKLNKENSESVLIKHAIEFRKGERTGNEWSAFCPSCQMPVEYYTHNNYVECSKKCGWNVDLASVNLSSILTEMNA